MVSSDIAFIFLSPCEFLFESFEHIKKARYVATVPVTAYLPAAFACQEISIFSLLSIGWSRNIWRGRAICPNIE
jgi:hypothetical protein